MIATRTVSVTALEHLDDEAYDDLVARAGVPFRASQRATVGRAFEALHPSHRHRPHRAVFSDGTSVAAPLTWVERRFSRLNAVEAMPLGLEGTPIVLDGELRAAHVDALFRALPSCGRLVIHGGAGSSPPAVGDVLAATTHTLDLERGFDHLWETCFSSKNRNSCRKADRAGVAVARATTTTDVEAYHGLYAAASRRWGYDTPPYPVSLFTALHASGYAEVWLATLDGVAVAGALMLIGSQDVLYWSGAMDREHQGLAPSNVVLRDAIADACRRGFSTFDFGASGELTGVSKFKASFGATERSYSTISLERFDHRALERARSLSSRVVR